MTLGMAARRSTVNATGWRSQAGANSERKIATPNASGVATQSAIADETSVPYTAGAAPKCPATGSQSLDVRKLSPNVRNAGQPARPTATKINSRTNGTNSANHLIDQPYTRSPISVPISVPLLPSRLV